MAPEVDGLGSEKADVGIAQVEKTRERGENEEEKQTPSADTS
jgi:hypothetical protein